MSSSSESGAALLWTPEETAKALAISPRKLWGMTAAGEIPHIRLGRLVRYSVTDLEWFIKGKREGGADDQ